MSEKAYRAKKLVWIQNPEGQWPIAATILGIYKIYQFYLGKFSGMYYWRLESESGTLSRSIPFREIENAKDSAEENYKTLWQSGGVEV